MCTTLCPLDALFPCKEGSKNHLKSCLGIGRLKLGTVLVPFICTLKNILLEHKDAYWGISAQGSKRDWKRRHCGLTMCNTEHPPLQVHSSLGFPAEYASNRHNTSSRIWKYHLHTKWWVNSWGKKKRPNTFRMNKAHSKHITIVCFF